MLNDGEGDRGYASLRAMTTPWIESCRGSVPAWEVHHVGNSSLRIFHRMTNARTGDEVATLEQSGVHLGREARRPTPLPDGLRTKARAMLVSAGDGPSGP